MSNSSQKSLASLSEAVASNKHQSITKESQTGTENDGNAPPSPPFAAKDEPGRLLAPDTRENTVSPEPDSGTQQALSSSIEPLSEVTDQAVAHAKGLADKDRTDLLHSNPDPQPIRNIKHSMEHLRKNIASQLAIATRKPRNPNSVNGALLHIVNLEERLARLESSAGKFMGDDEQANFKLKDSVNATTINVQRGIRFYDMNDENERELFFAITNNEGESPTIFVDSKYSIRVLCEWSADTPLKSVRSMSLNPPEPHEIDIHAFGILSKPIAEICDKQLNLSSGISRFVRFVKPFRPLILNLRQLKEHLSEL